MLGYLYINSIGQNAYFDKDGFVVETSTEVIDGVPKITGISCEEVVLYEKLQLENSDILRDLLNLTQTLKNIICSRMRSSMTVTWSRCFTMEQFR